MEQTIPITDETVYELELLFPVEVLYIGYCSQL